MTLYLIGIGLANEKDITVRGLEIVKKCDRIYLENYTSLLQCSKEDLEKFYGKEITFADREITEQGDEKIIAEAKDKEVAFLVIGDPFSATTHVQLFKLAKEKKVAVSVIHNASVLTAIGEVGLELYKYGRTTSIPFLEDHPQLETPYLMLQANIYAGMHTLCLLDLKPQENKFMMIKEALETLETIQKNKETNFLKEDTLVVGCARLGSEDSVIKAGTLKEIKNFDFGKPPYCLIIPGKLHFVEEEMLHLWSDHKL
ncbi:MAG: diphthine synthase [Nanoarchaeota archaeon]|nr:diphthine synthase [Nanoarchaeota archaeon]MBU1622882.1 diphthine synthase [Nanoarchaeota archaeon]MBU1974711.1 diphthine synthase [Nanoarchaeota archaeon]